MESSSKLKFEHLEQNEEHRVRAPAPELPPSFKALSRLLPHGCSGRLWGVLQHQAFTSLFPDYLCLTFVPCLRPISHCSTADKLWVEDDPESKHGRTICKSNGTMVSFVIPFPSSCVEQNIWAFLCNDVLQVKWFVRNGPWKYLNDGQFFGNPTNWQTPSCQRSILPFTIIRWIRERGGWHMVIFTDMKNQVDPHLKFFFHFSFLRKSLR